MMFGVEAWFLAAIAGVPISLATTLSGGESDRAGTLAFWSSFQVFLFWVEWTTEMLISWEFTKINADFVEFTNKEM
jgi:hypothetical protein